MIKMFCPNCREEVTYITKEESKTVKIKGENITYFGIESYCSNCGENLYIESIHDEDINRLDKTYREKKELIFTTEIEEILKKYNIGKRPLSDLLEWGSITITRYIDGKIPSKAYSDQLYRIKEDPHYYLEILQENKDKISDVAFKKSYKSVERIIKLDDKKKLEAVAQYILLNMTDTTPLSLQKLIYYTQGFFLAFNNKSLFEEDCEAWGHGPVYKKLYYKYRDYRWNPIDEDINKEEIKLTGNEKEFIEVICESFGVYSGKVLEKMTHNERPWQSKTISNDSFENPNEVITKGELEEYFSAVIKQYNMINTADIRKYANQHFKRLFR